MATLSQSYCAKGKVQHDPANVQSLSSAFIRGLDFLSVCVSRQPDATAFSSTMSRKDLRIQAEPGWLSSQDGHHVRGHRPVDSFHGKVADPHHVRRTNESRVLEQAMGCIRRFGGKDVQCNRTKLAAFKPCCQYVQTLNDPATRGVDQERAALHSRDSFTID